MAANRYSPFAFVVVFSAVRVPVLVKVTSALAMTAPVLSLTAPVIEPVPCANNVGANRISSGKNIRLNRCIQMLLFQSVDSRYPYIDGTMPSYSRF